MTTRRHWRNKRKAGSIGSSACLGSGEKLDSRVTVLAIERALAELGVHAKLSDIVTKAQSIKNGIIQSRSRRRPEQVC